ncbi:MAG: helix-turn-helix transcriptional regulator [Pseudomonadota bacterium]
MNTATDEVRTIDDTDVADFVAQIGQRVRRARVQKALSRRALSEQSGVSQRYLAQLEAGSGNISVALLYRVARALGQSPDFFFGDASERDVDQEQFLNLFRKADEHQKRRALAELQPTARSVNKGRRICLIGLRGAGKSTLGKLLAEQLGMAFVELNQVIEEESGMPVAEVMALYGQEGYRQLERKALETVFETRQSVVLAVGGGIVSEQQTYDQLLRTFHTVWLRASPEEHMERVRAQGDNRPMAGNPKAMDDLRSILTSRENLYARADMLVDTSNKDVAETLADLMESVERIGQS